MTRSGGDSWGTRLALGVLVVLGVMVVLLVLVVVVVSRALSGLAPGAFTWHADQKNQVGAFAERVAVVGELDRVDFLDSAGTSWGGPGASATITLVPAAGSAGFTQADFDRFDSEVARLGWHIDFADCYEGDLPGLTGCPVFEGATIRYHRSSIHLVVPHDLELPERPG